MIARTIGLALALVSGCAAGSQAPVAPRARAATRTTQDEAPRDEGRVASPGPRFAARALALHEGAPDGPIIGRLLAGAAVHAERVRGAHAEVRLPVFERPVLGEVGVSPRPLLAWVEADGLRAEPVDAPEPPPIEGRRARDHYTRLAATEGAPSFAWSVCGAITIVEERRDETGALVATRAAQRRERVELVGWTETPIRTPRGDFACRPRIVVRATVRALRPGEADPGPEPLPEGFVEADPDLVAPTLTDRARRGGSAWLLVHDGARFLCEQWRFSRGERDREGTLRGRFSHVRRDGAEWVRIEHGYELSGDVLLLLGPSVYRHRGGPRGPVARALHAGCGSVRRLVGGDDARWVWLPGDASAGLIRGYHPDDAEIWFADRASCESARDAEDESALSSGC